ncbi:hypothetical protein BH23PLA1_BH23PLA1_16730 [soil metagenome]
MNFSLQQAPPAAPATQREDLPPIQHHPAHRPSRTGRKILALTVVLVIGGAAALLGANGSEATRSRLSGLSDWFSPSAHSVLTHKVRRADLAITVKEKGELESANNIEAKCEVEGQTTIISILPEGTRVERYQLVCELDDAALRDQLANQQIAKERAKADFENARKTFEVKEIDVKEYIGGIYPQELKTIEGEIKLNQSELARAEDRLKWSDDMVKLGYITVAQNIADRFDLQKAEFNLQQARQKLDVLQTYTRPKQIITLEGEVEKSRADLYAKESAFTLENEKEERLRRMIEKCKIYAPGNGIVVYQNERNRFGSSDGPQIEEGAMVRERQIIFKLPDIDNMQVNTKVHESMVDKVKPGLGSRIRVDAFPRTMLSGTVVSVAPLPDPNSMFSSDVKVYSTIVSIQGNSGLDLRPGMTSEVEVLIARLENVLSVPVQSVIEFNNKHHVWVYADRETGWERREVELGMTNSKYIEIKDGLNEAEVVTLDPRAVMTEEERQRAFSSGEDREQGSEAESKTWSDSEAAKAEEAKELPSVREAAETKAKGGRGGAGRGGAGALGGMSDADREAFMQLGPEEKRQRLEAMGITVPPGGGGPRGEGGGRPPGGGGPGGFGGGPGQ